MENLFPYGINGLSLTTGLWKRQIKEEILAELRSEIRKELYVGLYTELWAKISKELCPKMPEQRKEGDKDQDGTISRENSRNSIYSSHSHSRSDFSHISSRDEWDRLSPTEKIAFSLINLQDETN